MRPASNTKISFSIAARIGSWRATWLCKPMLALIALGAPAPWIGFCWTPCRKPNTRESSTIVRRCETFVYSHRPSRPLWLTFRMLDEYFYEEYLLCQRHSNCVLHLWQYQKIQRPLPIGCTVLTKGDHPEVCHTGK